MNPHTAAAIIGQSMLNSIVIAELVALLSTEQRALLRERLQQQAHGIEPITEYEPDCSDYQRERFAEWDRLLAP